MNILVVICTYNPNRERLTRTLDGLRHQTLTTDRWNLLMIDNASTNRFIEHQDLSWHKNAAVVRENEPGIAAARNRAYNEIKVRTEKILLFVDDDTILDPNYLETGLGIGDARPDLGCWGGQLLPEYEIDPPNLFQPYLKYIAVSPLSKDVVTGISDYTGFNDVLPPCAGMFLRKNVAIEYLDTLVTTPLRLLLGAKGDHLLRGEDTDFCLFAMESGFFVGRFQSLRLTHLINRSRVTLEYLARLLEGVAASGVVIQAIRGQTPKRKSILQRLRQRWQIQRLPKVQSKLMAAQVRGERLGLEMVEKFSK